MEEKFFQIREFAQIARTSRKTLQYYDELGLFQPAAVGENGYRYYTLPQLDRLAVIAALRDMGLSLREIKAYLQCGDGEKLNSLLAAQLDRADQLMEQLRRRKALLRETLSDNRLFQSLCGRGCQLLDWPPLRAAKLMDLERDRPACVVVNYITDGLRTGLCVQEDGQFLYQRREDGELLIPGGTYLCLCELSKAGPQEGRQAVRLREYAAREGLGPEGGCFVEYNDLLSPQREGQTLQMRLLRVRVTAADIVNIGRSAG